MDFMEGPEFRRSEALASARAFTQYIIGSLQPDADPETKLKVQHARFQYADARDTVRFAAFAGAQLGKVTRPVMDEIAEQVVMEVLGGPSEAR